MNSLQKKIMASLMIALILFSHSINVFASIEESINNDVETMNYTEESNYNCEEDSVVSEESNYNEEVPNISEESDFNEEVSNISKETNSISEEKEIAIEEKSENVEKAVETEETIEVEKTAETLENTIEKQDTIIEKIEETKETEKEENIEIETKDVEIVNLSETMPAQVFEQQIGTIQVKVMADEGAFYKDTSMKISLVEPRNIIDSIEGTVDGSVSSLVAVDIAFYDKDNNEVEPANSINVSITSDEISEMEKPIIVHIDDKGETDIVNNISESEANKVSFEADEFSIYAIVGTKNISTLYSASNGNTYEVTVTYGPEAKIPFGSTIKVTEFSENTENYNNARNALLADMQNKGESNNPEFNIAALDISILDANGIKIEPKAPVSVTLKIKSLPGVEDISKIADSIEIQHHKETVNGIVIDQVNSQEQLQNQVITTSFDIETFSTFTITWSSKRSVTIHYGYMNNNSFVEFTNNPTQTVYSTNYRDYLIRDFEGYRYSGYTYYLTSTTANPSSSGTRIQANLRYSYGDWQYRKYSTSDNGPWNDITNDSHIYVVYEINPSIQNGGTPNATANQNTEPPKEPDILKESTDNNDGTRTISLSVTGHTKNLELDKLADVIVVFDVSGSMNDYLGYSSRLQVAKNAVNTMANTLLSKTNSAGQKLIRMSLITFSTNATLAQGFTDNYNTFSSAVNKLSANGGTNWEQALQLSNQMQIDSERATFVIFVSDGDPTFRVSRYGAEDKEISEYSRDNIYLENNLFGNGTSDPNNRNFDAAVVEAKSIVNHNKNFYTIGISNDVSKMANLNSQAGGKGNYTAKSSTELEKAFNQISESIQGILGWGVNVSDGITGLTNLTAKTPIVGVDTNSFKYYKNGTEWNPASEGANTAKYNSSTGAVEWNLGDNFQLDNEVTYKVSFTVWASQVAYDYVTKLNNNEIAYSQLPNDIKEQIVESSEGSGKYILKTNTSDAHVSYKMSSKVGDTVNVIGQAKKAYFNEVSPLNLDTMTLKVKKVFTDTLTQGEDRGNEVSLYLQRRVVKSDGTFGEWEDFAVPYVNPNGERVTSNIIVLGTKNNWTAEFYVSPGLIASGNTYNQGYEFRVTEPTIDYHYELNSETIRPMLVNNVKTYIGDTDNNQVLTGENVVKGGINVKKVLRDQDGNEIVDNDTEFTIVGYILDENNNPYTFNTAWDNRTNKNTADGASEEWKNHQNDTGAYHLYDSNGNRIGYKLHFASTGEIVLKLKAGQSVRFVNVPKNSKFEFHETDIPKGYEFNSVTGVNQTKDSNNHYTSDGIIQPSVTENAVSSVVYGNVQHNVTITNKAISGDLEISKTVVGTNNKEKEFTFTIELDNDTINEEYSTSGIETYKSLKFKNGIATLKLKADEKIKIEGLPSGIRYLIKETQSAGYTADSQEKEGNISAGTTTQTNFINTYTAEGKAKIEVSKELAGRKLEAEQFSFVLKDEAGKEIETVKNDAEGKITFSEISYNQDEIGTYKYQVTEVKGQEKGYTYDPMTVEVTVTVTDNGDGTLGTSVSYSEDTIFNNAYTAEGKAKIEVSKELAGRKLEAEQFSFVLKDEAGKEIETVKNDAEGKITFSEISYNQDEIGTYKYQVAEVKGQEKGYIYDSLIVDVTVTVTDNGDGTLGTSVSYSDDIVFNNIFETININVIKEWNDQNNKFSYRPDSIIVRLFANGVEIKNTILNKANEWKYIFANLDKYSAGEEIEYTISEDNIFGYTAQITGEVEKGFVITNNLDSFGGGDPEDAIIPKPEPVSQPQVTSEGTQNVINSSITIFNPSTGAKDYVVICMALSFVAVCCMIVATKKYKKNSNK